MSNRLTLCNSILTGPKPIDVSVGYRTLPNRPEPLNLSIGSRGFLDHCVGQSSGTATGGFTGGTGGGGGGGGPTTPTTPVAGPSSVSTNIIKPVAGPSSISTNIVKPTVGPSDLTDDLTKPVAGPSGVSTNIVKPTAGPDQINSTISYEFQDSDVGRQFLALQTKSGRGIVAGQFYTITEVINSEQASHSGGGSGIRINAISIQWEWWDTPAVGPSGLSAVAEGPSIPQAGPSSLAGEVLWSNLYSVSTGTSGGLTVGETTAIEGVQNFSQAFWFKSSRNTDAVIQVSNTAAGSSATNWIKIFNQGGVQFRFGGTSYQQGLDDDSLNDSEWHFLVQTYDAGYLSVYIDGVQVGVSNNFLIPTTAPAGWTDEMRFIPNEGNFDEWGVWDVTLDAANVLALYNNGSPIALDTDSGNYTKSQDLVRWEEFNDTTYFNPAAGETGAPVLSNDLPTFTNRHNIYLNGQAWVDAGVLTDLQDSDAMSLSFWFRSSSAGAGPSIGSRTGFTDQWGFLRTGGLNYVQVVTGSSGKYFTYSSPADSDYHHYVLTFSAGELVLYIDGSEVSYTATNAGTGVAATLHSENVSFDIGRNGSFYSTGDMDEVSLFDKALSQSEVTSIYNSGTPNDISSLSPLAWWRMGDSNSRGSNTVIDVSGNGNDATLENALYSETTP